jgi:hypothetical protein
MERERTKSTGLKDQARIRYVDQQVPKAGGGKEEIWHDLWDQEGENLGQSGLAIWAGTTG